MPRQDFKRGGERWAFVLDWIERHHPDMKPNAPQSDTAIFRHLKGREVFYAWTSRGKEISLKIPKGWASNTP